jgi:hypothetical protein
LGGEGVVSCEGLVRSQAGDRQYYVLPPILAELDSLLINNHRHPLLAMHCLTTIHPNRRRIINHNRIRRRAGATTRRYGHKSRKETGHV